jgi:hypothetical protein
MTKLQLLELQRTEAQKALDEHILPCPECGKDVRGIPWDENRGGECPHCVAAIEPEEMKAHSDAHRNLWDKVIRISELASFERTVEHIQKLKNGLLPLESFLRGGLLQKDFTAAVYKMLMYTFDNIAHYDRDGFYHTQFGTLADSICHLERMRDYVPLKGPSGDLEKEIQEVLEETCILPKLRERYAHETEVKERAELERLMRKYSPV